GRQADLEQRIAKMTARDDYGTVDAHMDSVSKWSNELKTIKARREELTARLSTNEAEALDNAQSLITLLYNATGDKRVELRERLKGRIRQLVERIDVLVWQVVPTVRAADVQVRLQGGKVRVFWFAWTHGGRYPGCSLPLPVDGIGSLVSG